jgi:serine phosphatase RsbU (regulator of sigma subunit)
MMELPLLASHMQLPRNFTDLVFLTNKGHMPAEIRKLVRQKRLSYSIVPISNFSELRKRTHLIGTAIIDAQDLGALEHQKVGRVIQALEQQSIGVIMLTHRIETPVKSFSLSPSKTSFSMSETSDSISIDDLWVQISVNLAYRKKSYGILSRPVVPASKMEKTGTNKLAEQLQMTGALVENLTEQLKLAGQVQRDFLPSQLPQTDRVQWATTFLPAEWVSGDIYSIIQLDDTHVGFYIVDAVGHGMPAALLTIFVKQALCMRETDNGMTRILSPSEVISQLNVKMARAKLSGYQFATCCYCLLNTETMELTYARAGHPYPLHMKPGQRPEQLEIRGSLLGVFEQSEYPERTVQLESGDKIVLYSDGAEPFMGTADDKYDFDYFDEFMDITHLPAVEMMDSFTALTKAKEIDPGSFDDITMVSMEVTD